MPSGRTHLTAAVLTYAALALSQQTPAEVVVMGAAVAGVAALGPDLDRPGSAASRLLWPVTMPLALLLGWAFGHRGAVHSAVVALLVCSAAWYLLPSALAEAVAWGWCSHLLLDACTPRRLPALLWPLLR